MGLGLRHRRAVQAAVRVGRLMARAVGFNGSNQVFRAPPGLPQDECYDLPVFLDLDGRQIISAWRLTPEELVEVQKTGVVWLSIVGLSMSPVLVSGTALVTVDGAPAQAEPLMPLAPRSKG